MHLGFNRGGAALRLPENTEEAPYLLDVNSLESPGLYFGVPELYFQGLTKCLKVQNSSSTR